MRALQSWLVEAHLISPETLEAVQRDEPLEGYALAAALLDKQLLDEAQLVTVLSQRLGVPAAPERLYRVPISATVLGEIPEDLCWQHHVFPFGVDRGLGKLQVAMADPTDEEARATLERVLGHAPTIHVIGPRHLQKAIRKHYLDSWVEETQARGRRFCGYDDITNPGHDPKTSKSSLEPAPSAVEEFATPEPAPVLDIAPEPAFDDMIQAQEADDNAPTRQLQALVVETPSPAAVGPPAPVPPPPARAKPGEEAGPGEKAAKAAGDRPAGGKAAGGKAAGGKAAGGKAAGGKAAPAKAAPAKLGRVALREERVQDRLAAVERALTDLLELLAELPDPRVSATAAEIRKKLRER